MINIKIICVGKIKETFFKEAIYEYEKRLSKFCTLDIIELPDEKVPDKLNNSTMDIVKQKEADLILQKLNSIKSSYTIALDETGLEVSSINFSNELQKISNNYSTITFIIGGSLGLAKSVKESSNKILSFSKLTFPHQLFRIFLLEQLFRSFKIASNEQYHH